MPCLLYENLGSGRHNPNLYYTFIIPMQVSLMTPWSRFCIDGGFLLRTGGDTVAMVTLLVPALSVAPLVTIIGYHS